jgi:hypothetical protein
MKCAVCGYGQDGVESAHVCNPIKNKWTSIKFVEDMIEKSCVVTCVNQNIETLTADIDVEVATGCRVTIFSGIQIHEARYIVRKIYKGRAELKWFKDVMVGIADESLNGKMKYVRDEAKRNNVIGVK